MLPALQSGFWARSLDRGIARVRSLRWPARHAAAGRPLLAARAEDLRRSRAGLLRFGLESDREFTELAKELSRFSSGLDELRRQSARLTAVVQDRDEERALSSAYTLYKSSVDLVHASIGMAVSEQEQMRAVETDLVRAIGDREHLERHDMMLRILTLNIRMESVRLEPEYQSVFVNVAANIAEIATKVMTSSAEAFGRIEAILGEAAAERRELGDLEEVLHRRAHVSVETIFRELEKLRVALEPCAERNRHIEELLAGSAPLTLGMLMALQHQDIVRQKLEHVAVGFDDIAGHLAGAASGRPADAAFVHQAARLQHSQLTSARGEIATAGRELTDGMARLLGHGEGLLAAFVEMERTVSSAFHDCRIAELYRVQITELAGIADQAQKTNEKVAASVARISDVVHVFTREIAVLEFEVKIVALNAQVAAARMTSAEALNKLSEECSRVSDQISRLTGGLATQLAQVLEALQRISGQAEQFLQLVGSEKRSLEQGAVRVATQLANLSATIQGDATRATQDFAKLFGETKNLLQKVRFPELVEGCFAPAEALCAALQQDTGAHAAAALDPEAAAKITAHRDRYTMEAERQAHASALGVTAASVAPVAAAVELFDFPEPAGVPASTETRAPAEADYPPPPPSACTGESPAAPQAVDPGDMPSAVPASEPAPEAGKPAAKPDLGPGIELF